MVTHEEEDKEYQTFYSTCLEKLMQNYRNFFVLWHTKFTVDMILLL